MDHLNKKPTFLENVNMMLSDTINCINIDPNKVIPSKRNQRLHPKTAGKKWPGQTIPRQPIIDRCIERYRRLAIRDKRKFLTWYKKQNFPKQK